MNKTTTKYGMFGIAAIVAILSISLLATNLTTQDAAAAAANKNGFSSSNVTAHASDGALHQLLEYEITSSDGKPWLVDFTAECSTATHVKASGKDKESRNTDKSTVEAEVFFTVHLPGDADNRHWAVSVDGVQTAVDFNVTSGLVNATQVPDNAKWNFCKQELELTVQLNELFTRNQTSGELIFECDLGEPLTAECEQSVEIFLENAGTRVAKAVLEDLPHGDTYVYVWGELSEDGSNSDVDPERTSLWIGKRILVVDPLHFDGSSSE